MGDAKVQIKGVVDLQEAFGKHLKESLRDEQLLGTLGQKSADFIRGATRARNKAHFDGVSYKDYLEKDTIARRDRLSEFNATANTYSKARANLTFSGQLLDSLTPKTLPSKPGFELGFEGQHGGYVGVNGKRNDSLPNETLAAYVQETRPFLFMSEPLKTILNSEIVRNLRRQISAFKRVTRSLK